MELELQSPQKRAPERHLIIYLGLIGGLAVLALARALSERMGLVAGRLELASAACEIVLDTLLVAIVMTAFPQLLHEMRRRRATAAHAEESLGRIELLFNMTDMLQSALGHADANSVLRATASALLQDFGGALYIFNNSGDRLELSTSWQWPETVPLNPTISPSDCWAIKRGKAHFNLAGSNALCCEHQQCCVTTMEIPMMARGEIYGLFIVQRDGAAAPEELATIAPAANALADAMSLSLSNLALRERLRTQALRDALTGLYNRRYMEDALERLSSQSLQTRSPLSVVMIDLDHFKKLNDEHGHSMGDAVLSEAASAILSGMGPRDIACRYGGEELVVLLPDTGLEDATSKAEMLRRRIERLSDRHEVPISASLGVATIAETSEAANVLIHADKALYRAKQEGRNRVVAAPPCDGEVQARRLSAAA